ncbi:MAG: hypothetical protein KAU31_14510, partial [Spirochaetaceae bacterium]|nr:hypothetical protein [Spirochaetaceae bacterium]
MKRGLVFIAIIALAAFALSGCGTVLGFVFETNLWIDNIELDTPDGNIAGVNIRFRNDGVWVDDVEFIVVLSSDAIIDDSDIVVYEGYFDIGFKGEEHYNVGRVVDMEPYLGDTGVPDGDYHIGVIVDPWDDIDEDDERDNTRVSQNKAYWGAGGASGLDPDFADEYSPFDNDYWNATHLALDAAGQNHNFHEPGDVDWYNAEV